MSDIRERLPRRLKRLRTELLETEKQLGYAQIMFTRLFDWCYGRLSPLVNESARGEIYRGFRVVDHDIKL